MAKKLSIEELLEQAKITKAISAPMYNLLLKTIKTTKKDQMSLDATRDILVARIDAYKESKERKDFCKKLLDIVLNWLKI